MRRTALGAPALRILAEADAFRSIGLDRRQALWRVARYLEAGTPAASVLPLFAETPALPAEPDAALPAMPLGEHVLTDYATLRLSLKAHPMALLRPQFARLGYVKAEALASLPANRAVRVAGIVLIRQRPGSASGVIFSTLEDETGIANLIIWPKIFERFRRIVLTARLLGVRGVLQSQDGAVHVVARELTDLSAYLAGLSEEHSEARKTDGRCYGTPGTRKRRAHAGSAERPQLSVTEAESFDCPNRSSMERRTNEGVIPDSLNCLAWPMQRTPSLCLSPQGERGPSNSPRRMFEGSLSPSASACGCGHSKEASSPRRACAGEGQGEGGLQEAIRRIWYNAPGVGARRPECVHGCM